jgi:hypothetical protein
MTQEFTEGLFEQSRAGQGHTDEPGQPGFLIFQSGMNGIEYASVDTLIGVVGKELTDYLPHFTAFHFSKQNIDDYLAIRLQVGVCHKGRFGILHHLWVYLKLTKRWDMAAQIDYVISGTVSLDNARLVTASSRKLSTQYYPRRALQQVADRHCRIVSPLQLLQYPETGTPSTSQVCLYYYCRVTRHCSARSYYSDESELRCRSAESVPLLPGRACGLLESQH